jgi:hypothetical protein
MITNLLKKQIVLLVSMLSFFSIQAQTPNFQWARAIGDTAFDYAKSITIDDSGNVYTVGTFQGIVDFNPGLAVSNLTSLTVPSAFISKLDANGNFKWAKKIGGTSNTYGEGIAISNLGDIYITGYFYGTTDFNPSLFFTNNISCSGGSDAYILKLSSSGVFVWVKTIGDIGNDVGRKVKVNNTGDVYITGKFEQTVDFNPGASIITMTATNKDAFILKLDASGNFGWSKKLGGTGIENAIDMSIDHLGNVYSIGSFDGNIDLDPSTAANLIYTTSGLQDIYISKLDASGNFVWGRKIGNAANNFATAIANDTSGNPYITGYFEDTLDFNPNNLAITNLIADFTDAYILKLNPVNGYLIWVKQIGGSNFDEAHSITIDQNNNSYITGQFKSNCDFDPNAGVFTLNTTGNGRDLFVLKLSDAGNFIWVKATGGNGVVNSTGIVVSNTNEVLVAGYFEGTVDFDDPNAVNFSSTGLRDIFIYKLNQNSVSGFSTNTKAQSFSIFPNPTSTQLHIVFDQEQNNTKIKLIDVFGKTIQVQTFTGTSKSIDVTMLNSGIYYLQVMTTEKIRTQKIIVK